MTNKEISDEKLAKIYHREMKDRNFVTVGMIGAAHSIREEYDDAEKYLKESLELLPDNPLSIQDLAEVYFQKGDLEKAIELTEELAQSDPKKNSFKVTLGRYYAKAGRLEDAVNQYEQVVFDDFNMSSEVKYSVIIHTAYKRSNNFQEFVSEFKNIKALGDFVIGVLRVDRREEKQAFFELNKLYEENGKSNFPILKAYLKHSFLSIIEELRFKLKI